MSRSNNLSIGQADAVGDARHKVRKHVGGELVDEYIGGTGVLDDKCWRG